MNTDRIVAAERLRTDETLYTLQINEVQCEQLASGFVPKTVKVACIDMLTLLEQDERKAARPVEPPRRRKA